MKISLNWLKEFVDFKLSAKELAEKISMSLVEVEEIIDFEKLYKGVIVGEIKEIKKHPNTDKLSMARVLIGKKTIQIIFGGLNLRVSNKLPIALAGAVLPTGLEVKKTQIRGIESEGMIASNKELGLDYAEDEITFFGNNVKTGISVVKILGMHDIVLNLDVLSNRPDLFSHFGVAKEVGAILRKKIKAPKIKAIEAADKKINDLLEIEVKDKDLCPRYQARVIAEVKVGESPFWLKNRLMVLGIRPVNNVVDITNYVMMELGQPLHAFDFNKIESIKISNLKSQIPPKKIIIRRAKRGEEIVTLDEKERKLTKDILVIADVQKPIAVAGVIGGKDTEVEDETKTVILESANFYWAAIRQASRILGVRTEAVNRFEKNLDHNLTDIALDRAAQMISQIAKGKILQEKIDKNYAKDAPKTVELRIPRLNKFLGQNISSQKIRQILASLGMEIFLKDEKIIAKIPSFRKDINEEADLIEEIARLSGYDRIPTTSPVGEVVPPPKNLDYETENRIKDIFKGLWVTEISSYTFVGEELLRKFGQKTAGFYQLQNPLSPEHTYLRKNLIFSMVEVAESNAKNFEEFSIFEIARVFGEGKSKFPKEKRMVSILVYHKMEPFYKLKGILEGLFEELGIKNISFGQLKNHSDYWHPQRTANILVNGISIGKIGELHPEVWERFDFKNRVAVSEIDFSELVKRQEIKIFTPISKFPKIVLDMAVVVNEKLQEADIRREIVKAGKGLVESIKLFDVYRGAQIGTLKKSLAYHITYQSKQKTLTDEEANSIHQAIIKVFSLKFNAKIRSKDGS